MLDAFYYQYYSVHTINTIIMYTMYTICIPCILCILFTLGPKNLKLLLIEMGSGNRPSSSRGRVLTCFLKIDSNKSMISLDAPGLPAFAKNGRVLFLENAFYYTALWRLIIDG